MSLKIDYPENRKEKYANKGVEKVAFLSKNRKKNNKNSINEKREEQANFVYENRDGKNKQNRKRKRLEHRNCERIEKRKSEKEEVRKQKEELAAQKRKIREEREEIFVRKLIAKKNKYRNRISKIERKFGKTQIEIYGENAVKALSAISKIAKVEKVAVGKQSTSIFVESKQCHKIIALLQNLCYDYKIINIGGVACNFPLVDESGIDCRDCARGGCRLDLFVFRHARERKVRGRERLRIKRRDKRHTERVRA